MVGVHFCYLFRGGVGPVDGVHRCQSHAHLFAGRFWFCWAGTAVEIGDLLDRLQILDLGKVQIKRVGVVCDSGIVQFMGSDVGLG